MLIFAASFSRAVNAGGPLPYIGGHFPSHLAARNGASVYGIGPTDLTHRVGLLRERPRESRSLFAGIAMGLLLLALVVFGDSAEYRFRVGGLDCRDIRAGRKGNHDNGE